MKEYKRDLDSRTLINTGAAVNNRIVDFPAHRNPKVLLSDMLRTMIRARYERIENSYRTPVPQENVNSAA